MNPPLKLAIPALLDTNEFVNLTNCDREPIHIPGSIQPHGVLFVLREPTLQIVQVSANTTEILGIEPAQLCDRPLEDWLGTAAVDIIRDCLDRSFENINPLPLSIPTTEGPTSFNGIVHRTPQGEVVLELEPLRPLEPLQPAIEGNFFRFYQQIKTTLATMQRARTLSDLCDLIVQEVKQVTGFDRVMIYRFGPEGDGTVIAEAKQPELETFLGMHYPDTDIPKQAKYLYTLNWLRLIPDVDYQPVGLLTTNAAVQQPNEAQPDGEQPSEIQPEAQADSEQPRDTQTSETQPAAPATPLDMSYCSLRAVSPIHIEYLKNMGVGASMSVSLIQNQQLWGLIACHHNTPRFVPYELRTICEFLGQLMSTELAAKEANENLDYKLHLKNVQGQFVERLARAIDFVDELMAEPSDLLALTGAQGAAICEGDAVFLIGQTPSQAAIQSLLTWLTDRFEQDLFVTDALSKLYGAAADYKEVGSGLLAMAISRIQRRYVLWFRPEMLQTVTWAGNPEKPKRVEADGTLTIFPRQSFEAWQETVSGQSNPWLDCEVQGAIELRQAIVDIVLRQSDELASINLELERSNNELDAFAYIASHDLKEPLRGIHNYATFLLEDYGEILQEDGAEKLHTLVRLTQRMESLIESLLKYSRLGRQELQRFPVDLNSLLQNVVEVFNMNPKWSDCSIRIPHPLPVVMGDRSLIEEIFANLISNAFKYNDNAEKWVEIGWHESSESSAPSNPSDPSDPTDVVTLYVQDNGIGIREKHLETVFRIFKRLHAAGKYGGGTGAGLTIVKKIVERHGGSIRVESTYGQGTTFWLTLPKPARMADS